VTLPDRSRKRPADLNRLAASIVDDANAEDKNERDDDNRPGAVELGSRGGRSVRYGSGLAGRGPAVVDPSHK
jgi:hypothetical protein